MQSNHISETDLILNSDGSAYHINLHPDDLGDTIITVGDPERVSEVSKYFDKIELKKSKREFITHTGQLGKKRVSVISTGIGTGNIDIVLNEFDALKNINLKTRTLNPEFQQLDIIRIGTSGAIQRETPIDSILVSSAAFGLDTLMNYYHYETARVEQGILNAFVRAIPEGYAINPYFISAEKALLARYGKGFQQGITITAPGFYAPQGRTIRVKPTMPRLLDHIRNFSFGGKKIANLEMETAGIYGLASALGHRALSFNVILANRSTHQFSKDPAKVMDKGIQVILEKIAQ